MGILEDKFHKLHLFLTSGAKGGNIPTYFGPFKRSNLTFFSNATTCSYELSWSPLLAVAEL